MTLFQLCFNAASGLGGLGVACRPKPSDF